MSDLEPCPFCGEPATHIKLNHVIGCVPCAIWVSEDRKDVWQRRTQPEATAPAAPSCRMQGGICACRSGGSFGGCAIERGIVHRGFVERPTAPAQDLSAAILAIECIPCVTWPHNEMVTYRKGHRHALESAAALASSANALSAVDRMDALDQISMIVDRDTPPDSRNDVIDHDIRGKPITRAMVEAHTPTASSANTLSEDKSPNSIAKR